MCAIRGRSSRSRSTSRGTGIDGLPPTARQARNAERPRDAKTLEVEGPVVRPWFGARERQESGLRKPARKVEPKPRLELGTY